MITNKWKNIIGTYLLALFSSWLLFFPIDVMVYGGISTKNIVQYIIVNFFCISITIIIDINIVRYFNSIFTRNKMLLRFFLEAICAIIPTNIVIYISQYIFIIRINIFDYFTLLKADYFFITSVESIFTMLIIEVIYMHNQRIKTDLEREKFKYNQLKNQLNPHFLFNSLNILSAMIYTKASSDESLDFIEKLSDFYHYVLKNEGKNLISLKEEIEFINKYGDILKIRFADGFVLKINLNEKDYNRRVLFMSLQLLVENAVKHNIASKEEPLVVSIYSENNFIICSNNKIIRHDNIVSTGLGLENLNERYKIISKKEIKIIEDKEKFTVKIPMI
ncbi:MAG: histidine kinase [Bacteroidales bacterium]|jgi:sensor histidine kinase YesM